MPKSMADYKWEVGTVFLDNNHFKDAIRAYAIHAGRNMKFLKNDSKRVRVGCLGAQNKCQWSAYCSYVRSRKIWQLRKLLDVHSCSREFKINIIKAKWLSETLDQTLIENPKLKINDVRELPFIIRRLVYYHCLLEFISKQIQTLLPLSLRRLVSTLSEV